MNRSALNSTRLGSGSSLPWITAAAAQVMRLVGSVRGYCVKYGSAAQTFTLTGSLGVYRYTYGKVSGLLQLVSTFVATVWQNIYAGAIQNFKLGVQAKAHLITPLKDDEPLALVGTVTPTVWRLVRTPISQSFYLNTSIKVFDLTTTPAAPERTAGMVDLTTRMTSVVVIGEA